jgi:tetratricopeptide (TPR) repeat protein
VRKSKKTSPPREPEPARQSISVRWIYLSLFLVTVAVYAPVLHFEFINFDDPDYVTANPHVRDGLTTTGIVWAFTSSDAANWFPVTRLSHLLDGQLFGVSSGMHHLTNLLFHAFATLLLFAFLKRATQARWPSAFVALLFALHPLHVESVAWVSERKDVLSAFFWFLTLLLYVRYTTQKSVGRYVLVLVAFSLGLMSKPMVVTLPFVLVLLDIWPLRRFPALLEKIPFFALAAAGGIVTYFVQAGSGAVRAVESFPVGLRIENAVVSYVTYIANLFWPANLAVFYPYPQDIPAWQVVLGATILLGVTALVARSFRARPYLAVGWFWFLGTLVPVIGLVQVGAQARADRYTYVPFVGLGIMLAWGATEIPRKVAASVAGVAGVAWIVLTSMQLQYWKNSESLFRHAVAVTDRNALAHHNLGVALAEDPGRVTEAIEQYQAALEIKPNDVRVHTDLGTALSKIPARLPEAVIEYQAALRSMPNAPIPHNNLGNTLSMIPGRLPEAIAEYETALRLKPDYAEAQSNLAQAHYTLGVELAKTPGRAKEAIPHFEEAIRLKPDYAEAHNNLGTLLTDVATSIAHFEAALRIDPNSADAHVNLAIALSRIPGRMPEAITHLEAALRIKPDPEVRRILTEIKQGHGR